MSNSSSIIPEPLKAQSLVYDLKKRLDWGEPALTIIDVRARDAFNISHISGAVSLQMNELVNRALNNFELERDMGERKKVWGKGNVVSGCFTITYVKPN